MRELQFDRLSDDGRFFVLIDSRGVRYTLPVSEDIATAARRGLQRTAIRDADAVVSPRDIQALIRSGHSVDDVVIRTGLAEDFVRRFAEPVLAEMDFVMQRARRLTMHSAGAQVTLEELAESAAADRGLDAADLTWSCAKVDDGLWSISTSYDDRSLLQVQFRVTDGTLTPGDDVTDQFVRGYRNLPAHWDVEHPAARAKARHAREVSEAVTPDSDEESGQMSDTVTVDLRSTAPTPLSPALFDDPSTVF